jgi:hypothetical protein
MSSPATRSTTTSTPFTSTEVPTAAPAGAVGRAARRALCEWTQARVLDGNNPTHPRTHAILAVRARTTAPECSDVGGRHPAKVAPTATTSDPAADRQFSGPDTGHRKTPNDYWS